VVSAAVPHTPVMLDEVLKWLDVKPEGTYIDATLGAGGHSAAIAERLRSGKLISLDQDAQALQLAAERLKRFGTTVTLVRSSFSRIAEVVHELGIPGVDGVLADLGVSSMQLDQAGRGFSFREAGPLDMRMDAEGELTADEIVNRWSEKEIADTLYQGAEEHDSRRIARMIVRARPIRDTAHLAAIVAGARKQWGRQRLHPATKTFLALRIAVSKAGQSNLFERERNVPFHLFCRHASHAQWKCDILVDGQMREKRVTLEHHPDVAMMNWEIGGELTVDPDLRISLRLGE